MSIDRFRYFLAVVQTGSVVKAAELLNISQPAVSRALQQLQKDLDRKLFVASGRGIMITSDGHRLANKLNDLVIEVDELKNFLADEPRSRFITIATFEVFSTYFMAQLISSEFPEQNFRLVEHIPGPMEEAISEGSADFGITYLPLPRPDLDNLKVGTVDMGIYGLPKFTRQKLADLPFVVPTIRVKGSPSRVRGLDGWPEDEMPRKVKYEVTLMESALQICQQGLAVGFFPSFIAELYNRGRRTEYQLQRIGQAGSAKKTRQDVFIIKRKGDTESQEMKKVARAIRALI